MLFDLNYKLIPHKNKDDQIELYEKQAKLNNQRYEILKINEKYGKIGLNLKLNIKKD